MNRFILSMIIAVLSVFSVSANALTVRTVGSDLPSPMHALAAWINQETRGRVVEQEALKIVSEAFKAGDKWSVDPLLILSIMKKESMYNTKARNKSGASGLMQVIPRWHKDKIQGRSMFNYKANIDVGAQVVNEYLQWHKESYKQAMHRYTGGASSKYGAVVQKTYGELKDVVLGWKMTNDAPVLGAHKYGFPRHYGTTHVAYAAYEKEREERRANELAYERLIKRHASVDMAYNVAVN